jgi:TatD DNase family protein
MISEIGLDFMDNSPDRAVQYKAFRRQIGVARELSLPIIFHCREAYSDAIRVLKEERAFEVGGAMHYFQGDQLIANQLVDLGFHISLGRPLLRLPDLQKIVLSTSINRILLETDSFPQPFKKNRTNWTEPRHIVDVANEIARIKKVDVKDVAKITSNNVLRVLQNATALKAYFKYK